MKNKEILEKILEKIKNTPDDIILKALDEICEENENYDEDDITEDDIVVNISLKEMFSILSNCILNNTEAPKFYYQRQNIHTGILELVEISEVDLMDSRFKTIDGDFSEYDWENNKSNIYMIGEYVNGECRKSR